uniref:Uncharacterized protein n=1 Tax=Sphaerodactylus townsendi TaxID=933632 RepID=A0ACB8EK31_9SAUR
MTDFAFEKGPTLNFTLLTTAKTVQGPLLKEKQKAMMLEEKYYCQYTPMRFWHCTFGREREHFMQSFKLHLPDEAHVKHCIMNIFPQAPLGFFFAFPSFCLVPPISLFFQVPLLQEVPPDEWKTACTFGCLCFFNAILKLF